MIDKIGRLAVRLAVESYFGENLMRQCTVFGGKDKPSLPKEKVSELKNKLMLLHSQFVSSPTEFEHYWSKFVAAINYKCAELREKTVLSDIINLSL